MSDALAAILRADPPLARVMAFSRRFGRETTLLAMHAALPLGLSPELVHLLRVNFVRDAPFIAEADLLLSPLCAEVGGGMYEMDPDVRELLLAELARTPGLGRERVRRVAHFLRVWATRALDDTADPDLREHLRVQQWVALSYADPARAAEALAGALRAGVEAADRPEVARVARLTTVLSAPLAAQVELRRYAGAVEALAGGRMEAVASTTGEVAVGATRLPGLNRVIRLWQPESGTTESAQQPQQQTNPPGEPPSGAEAGQRPSAEAPEAPDASDASAEHGYRVGRVLVIGPVQVGTSSGLLHRLGAEPLRPMLSGGGRGWRWRAWTGPERGAAHDVVFYEPEPDGGAFGVLVEESTALLLVLSGTEDRATLESWMATARGDRAAMVVVLGRRSEVKLGDVMDAVDRFGLDGPVLLADGEEDMERIRDAIRQLIPWGSIVAAGSPEEVEWLEGQLDARFGDLPVAEYGEAARHEIGQAMRIAHGGVDAALERAIACAETRGFVRVVGEPPWAIVRGQEYNRCVAEIGRAAAAQRHDVPELPSIPLNWLRERFSAPEFRGFLDTDPTPGVLDLVLEDLGHRRWIFQADTRRGRMVVVPSELSVGDPTVDPPVNVRLQPLLQATWSAETAQHLYVLLLVHLADLGRVRVELPSLAYVQLPGGTLGVRWMAEDGMVTLSLERTSGAGDVDPARELFRDVLRRYLPVGTTPEILELAEPEDAEPRRTKAAPRKEASQSAIPEAAESAIPAGAFPPEPPQGLNLGRACLVLMAGGRKKVGGRFINLDAVWRNLLEPAILDTRLPDGESLIPIRAWALPKTGTPLPDWTRAARMVIADLTGVSPTRLRELRMLPGMRTQTVVLFRESGAELPSEFASLNVFEYQAAASRDLMTQRTRVSGILMDALGLGTAEPEVTDTLLITADTLNVRQGPGRQHRVLGVLPKGTRVQRLEATPGWFRVRATDHALTGWISDKFAIPAEDAPGPLRLRVTAGSLNLRRGPGVEHAPVQLLSRGMIVDEVERSGDWILVRTPGAGSEGWLAAEYVESVGRVNPFAPREDDPPWYNHAWMELGPHPTSAGTENLRLAEYQKTVAYSATDDQVSLASAFANWAMQQAGLRGTGEAGARSWLKWGRKLDRPIRACVVVLSRPGGDPTRADVGFYVDEEPDRLLVLGANEGDGVGITPYPRSRVLGYRWPLDQPAP
ncbi:MAG TPA: TIGR02594 family protein [Longimicrobium sp.]|nr:TIGR02594 family protein [Longimicrobium sp.]